MPSTENDSGTCMGTSRDCIRPILRKFSDFWQSRQLFIKAKKIFSEELKRRRDETAVYVAVVTPQNEWDM
jgi:hypothetical protein